MKRVFLYILLTILFINNISFNQVFKIPVLVCHYMEHKHLNNHIGVMEFLSMHYWGKDINDKDHERDMQLPFKKTSEQTCFQLALPAQKLSHEKQIFVLIDEKKPMHPDEHWISKSLDAIFRPPKA